MTAVEWIAEKVRHNPLMSSSDYNKLLEQAKEMEREQREKDFIEGYKKRAEIGNSTFDEISETTAKVLFEEMLKSE